MSRTAARGTPTSPAARPPSLCQPATSPTRSCSTRPTHRALQASPRLPCASSPRTTPAARRAALRAPTPCLQRTWRTSCCNGRQRRRSSSRTWRAGPSTPSPWRDRRARPADRCSSPPSRARQRSSSPQTARKGSRAGGRTGTATTPPRASSGCSTQSSEPSLWRRGSQTPLPWRQTLTLSLRAFRRSTLPPSRFSRAAPRTGRARGGSG
mmetsp:Transcript_14031/g.41437  ORF Transcript_14031/g.41437 Transcript_14031/m.41437 type:complete len:210 (+) Transcript_14031:304-933(+)